MLISAVLLKVLAGALLIAAQNSTTGEESCYDNPRQDKCINYSHPNSTADMDDLCASMPYMSGCSIYNECKSNPNAFPEPYCKPFSFIADVCATDMPGMRGCKSWNKLCGNNMMTKASMTPKSVMKFTNTSVKQCSDEPPLPSLPNTRKINTQIISICTEMDMVGCDRCDVKNAGSGYMNCDLLGTYSFLCLAMPDMYQCVEWKEMCATNPNLMYCSGEGTDFQVPPTMKMFFHSGYTEYVMFESWIPRNPLQYWLSVAALAALSIVYEAMIAGSAILEAKWAGQNKAMACFPAKLSSCGKSYCSAGSGLFVMFARFTIKLVSATLGYALMLVTMTFNWGLFFGVIGGLAIGTCLFTGIVRKTSIESKGAFESSATSATACC